MINSLKIIRDRIRIIDFIITISKRIKKNSRTYILSNFKLFFNNFQIYDKNKKSINLIYKGMQLNYLNTFEKILSNHNNRILISQNQKEDLNKIISEDQEISPSKSDTNRNRFRNNYSKEWYYKYKNDGNHNLI